MRFLTDGVGCFYLSVYFEYYINYQPDEIELLSTTGNAIGVAIENAYLYEEAWRIAAKLQVSERKYRTLFENASEAILVHDLKGNILNSNKACAELTGYTLDELSHMNASSFLRKDQLALARDERLRLLRGENIGTPYERQLVRKDGTEAILRLTTNLLLTNGKPTAFQHIMRDVTEEKRMLDNQKFYVQQVVRAQEEERRRIALDLHDDTAQVLGSLSREVDNFIRKKNQLLPDEIAFLKYMRLQLNRGLQEVHSFCQNLRPPVLDDLGLLPALRSLIGEMKNHNRIAVDLSVLGSERRFSPGVELLIFRIVQEAFNNIAKHAEASRAWVEIEFTEGKSRLTISDNGLGFEMPSRIDDLPRSGRLGMAGMQERAQLLGGTLEIKSTLCVGTIITLELSS
ncbi:PAS domain-containing sensor histidine kinase [Chloroflexota bacterium]